MSFQRHIPWFNPREMDDSMVQALSTGREALLDGFFQAVRKRAQHPEPGAHWLVTGPRGAGKSFFLRLVQTQFNQALGDAAQFVLLPEEHSNIYAPYQFLEEIKRMLHPEQGQLGKPPAWRVEDANAAWSHALKELLETCSAPLLVVGVENFDQLLQQAFNDEVGSSSLRRLLAHEPRLMLLATAVQGDFDEAYGQRMFCQFEHHVMPGWDDEAHRDYLRRRADLQGKKPSSHQMARIQAYSHYTGGNARVAAVLAGAILDEQDPLLASADLASTLDRMTDYYRALLERIPPNTRKLFDALIRGGEPSSQTEIAERVGARQSDISRAFAWLIDHGYVLDEKEPGRKERRYRVADRLFVQFYRMRYLQPGQRSQLALLADLLADTIEFKEKWRYAERYYTDGHEDEARTMVELACRERNIDFNLLAPESRKVEQLIQLGRGWEMRDAIVGAGDLLRMHEEIFRRFSSDADFNCAYQEALELALAVNRGELQGSKLVSLLEDSLSLCPVEKYQVLIWMLSPNLTEFQWFELIKIFEDEVAEFKKLESTEKDDIDVLISERELGRCFPLACSFQHFAEKRNNNFELLKNVSLEVAARWAGQAVVLWISHKRPEEAAASLNTCFALIDKLIVDAPKIALGVLAILEPHLHDLTDLQYARFQSFKGCSLQELKRFDEAYDAYFLARQAGLRAERPGVAARSLERMSWCQGALGQIVEAIEGHQQAHAERLAQQNEESAAWNLGQMARYTARQSSIEVAWNLLDSMEPVHVDHRIVALQQLGDALLDCVTQEGEVKAFALGCQLLAGLAMRPQYPAEAALRALWIDMIDMGVPHVLLRDLLAELPGLFSHHKDDLALLCTVLTAWLDDLDCEPDKRAQRRKTLDPDLAVTLESLSQNLSLSTQRRLKLNELAKA